MMSCTWDNRLERGHAWLHSGQWPQPCTVQRLCPRTDLYTHFCPRSFSLHTHYLLLMFLGCWTRRDNIHGFGGRSRRNINSVAACQSVCLSDTSCVAIDYDPWNGNREYCWLLTSIYWTGRARGVTQYVINRQYCSNPGILDITLCMKCYANKLGA